MSDWFEAERRAERARELFETDRFEEALEELQAAIELNPYNASWHANKGVILDSMERFDDAIEAYLSAHDLEPNDVDIVAQGVLRVLREVDRDGLLPHRHRAFDRHRAIR